ncbi:MAG: ANTAR domain-containing response regulator [Acidimicrobiia bacterium]
MTIAERGTETMGNEPGRSPLTMRVVASDDQPLRDGLRELAGMLLGDQSVDRLLLRVASVAAAALPACHAASVTMVGRGWAGTAASAGELAGRVDRWQHDAGQGPCLHAVATGEVVRVDSFAADRRWPSLAWRAERAGVHSALSVPLAAGDEVLGALNLYSTTPGAFAGREGQAVRLGRQASVTLANAHALRRAEQLAQQLAEALETRDVIGQAKGIIMAAQHMSSDEAFDVLRRASQRANRKLRDVARDIVDGRNQARATGAEGGPASPAGRGARRAGPPGARSRSAS